MNHFNARFTEMVRGASAYEVAVRNGFDGTEEDWLESIYGKARDYSESAAKSEQNAKQAESDAQAAKKAAEDAQKKAEEAKTASETAKEGAETARKGAEDAKAGAEAARQGITDALSTANQHKTDAQNAQKAAEQSAENAKKSESTAGTKASEAAQSAANAGTSERNAKTSEEAAAKSAEIAKNAEGVKTVNGKTPDENGNVEVEGVTDYNKLENKPVGADVSTVEVLPETTVELDPDRGQGVFPNYFSLIPGNKYTVRYNGVEYESVCIADTETAGIPSNIIGNLGTFGGEDTGEPFCIFDIAVLSQTTIRFYDGSSATVSIIGEIETVEKLDKKFLPEHTHSFKGLTDKPFYAERNDEIILAETTGDPIPEMNNSIALPDVLDIKVGNIYTVRYNGVEYLCEAKASPVPDDMPGVMMGNMGAVTGESFDGEPFVIVCETADMAAAMGFGVLVMPVDGSASITISIHGATVHPLSSAYLPKMVVNFTQVNENATFNAVADRTLEEITDAVRKGYDVVGKITMPMGSNTFTAVLSNIGLTVNNEKNRTDVCVFSMVFSDMIFIIEYNSAAQVGSEYAETPVTVTFKTIA